MDESKKAARSVRMKPCIQQLTRHVDDRGDLCELFRDSWRLGARREGSDRFSVDILQVYTVFDPQPMTVRAYHRHEYLWDLFTIVSGSAKFHIIQGPDGFPLSPVGTANLRVGYAGDDLLVTLSARKPQLLVVPPYYWHGWMSLEPNTMLLSLASREYDKDKPDEERIPFDAFGDHIWKVWHK